MYYSFHPLLGEESKNSSLKVLYHPEKKESVILNASAATFYSICERQDEPTVSDEKLCRQYLDRYRASGISEERLLRDVYTILRTFVGYGILEETGEQRDG